MLSINFICRESKVNRLGLAPIEVSISYRGSRTCMLLPRKEKPACFRRQISMKRENELKVFLLSVNRRIQECFSELYSKGVEITPLVLKSAFKGEYSVVYTVSMLVSEYLDILKKRVDCDDLSLQVYFKYERVYKRLLDKCGGESSVSCLTNGVIMDIVADLKRDYEAATVCGYFTKIKSLIKYAIDNGRLSVNPCSGIKVSRGQKEVSIISMGEYERIRDKDFSYCPRLERVRDLFVFGCNSGLAFCDIVCLRSDDIREVDGRYVIEMRRRKTGVRFSAIVLDDGVRILEKYGFDLSQLFLSNQRLNAYSKEIQDICGVVSVSSLHYHLARHFYITRLLRSGVPLSVVKLCAGHSSIKLTASTYCHLTSTDVVESVKKVI